MDETLTPEIILRRPDAVVAVLALGFGERVAFRPLLASDGAALGRYFEGLSQEGTRRWWAPHPINAPEAEKICADLSFERVVRLVAVAQRADTPGAPPRGEPGENPGGEPPRRAPEGARAQESGSTASGEPAGEPCSAPGDGASERACCEGRADPEIVAYFLLYLSIGEHSRGRYAVYGIPLDDHLDCEFAPSVADAWQSRGLGSAMMPPLLEIARRLGRRRLILAGGVQALNARAVHFYEKFGFRNVGEFTNQVRNVDMILELV